MKYKKLTISLGLAVLAVLIILFSRKDNSESGQTTSAANGVPVSVSPAQRQRLASNISIAGTINPNNDVNVVSQTQGAVLRVHAKVGMIVRAGTVLVEIEDKIQRSNLATAEISYQKAKRDFERSETLFQENSISPAQLDAARLAMKAAENQMDIVRQQLEYTKITTPITGTVNSRSVDVGTMVQPGMPVANIVDITTLTVRTNVSEREAFVLKPGDPVEVRTDVYPDRVLSARVDNIASKSDDAHTYPVEIKMFNDAKSPLKAGMFCRISFRSLADASALAIHRVALVGSVKEASVFVVRNGIARICPIVVGKQTNDFFEVLRGLEEGDSIVTSGQNNLVDSTRVITALAD